MWFGFVPSCAPKHLGQESQCTSNVESRSIRTIRKVYAKVSIAGNSERTEPDLVNKINPEWNKTFSFIVPEINIIQAQAQVGATLIGAVATGAAAFTGN
ncbi:hypothetical protein RDI58_000094 [Solanum bulbocastanum]|uniref:C2 domain-containing protein n=1 Tax=Solanum bulbocastanum TaxID=147425 RepID=A0AAN8U2T7_SOLBU